MLKFGVIEQNIKILERLGNGNLLCFQVPGDHSAEKVKIPWFLLDMWPCTRSQCSLLALIELKHSLCDLINPLQPATSAAFQQIWSRTSFLRHVLWDFAG